MLRAVLAHQLGSAAEQVITKLVRDVNGGLLGSAVGRFFGWVIGGSVPPILQLTGSPQHAIRKVLCTQPRNW